jgi:DNA-binding CsgD family transcriptional regulator
LEEKVLLNIKELVEPYLFKLKSTGLTQSQAAYVKMLSTNLTHITSSFSQRLASPLFQLTPTEIQVANHIQQGLSTKEISNLCNLSSRTIESHRKNIRRKLGLQNKKINLRTHLMSLK